MHIDKAETIITSALAFKSVSDPLKTYCMFIGLPLYAMLAWYLVKDYENRSSKS